MNIARQSTFYPVGSHAGEGSKATFGSAFGYFVPIRGPLQDRVELGILAGTGGDPNKAKAAPCRNIVGNGPSPMAPKERLDQRARGARYFGGAYGVARGISRGVTAKPTLDRPGVRPLHPTTWMNLLSGPCVLSA